jgi:hypothetical protein
MILSAAKAAGWLSAPSHRHTCNASRYRVNLIFPYRSAIPPCQPPSPSILHLTFCTRHYCARGDYDIILNMSSDGTESRGMFCVKCDLLCIYDNIRLMSNCTILHKVHCI